MHTIVSRCNTNVPCDWFVHFLCQHSHASWQEKRVDRLPRNHCSFGNLCTPVGFAPTNCDSSPRFDLPGQTPQFDEFDDTSPSTASVCSIFLGRMTTSHPLPRYPRAWQARVSLQVWDWLRLFFCQAARVGRLTPNVRWTPRILDRSE